MKVTILGCGTSGGVPRIGPIWGRCNPDNPKNRRRRASILVEDCNTRLLVDTSPDLREQCLDAGINHLDGVLYTHDHADHTHGIDDLRAIVQSMGNKVDIYANEETLTVLRQRFGYVFDSVAGYPTIANSHVISGPFRAGGIDVTPFEQVHGPVTSLGFRFGPVAYSTDLNALPEQAFEVLKGVKVWIVDALRYEPHPTHAHLDLTLEWIERIQPEKAILTHMTWDMDYDEVKSRLPGHIEPAYDGMTIEI